jgi:hypothetical protein
LIGKVSYDLGKDEFSMNDTIALIGGGLQESVNFLLDRYKYTAQIA